MLKHADFASEWRKSHFWGLKILNFPGEDAPGPPYKGAAFGAPFVWTPYAENLYPCQNLLYFWSAYGFIVNLFNPKEKIKK